MPLERVAAGTSKAPKNHYYSGSNTVYVEAGNEPNAHPEDYSNNGGFDYLEYEQFVALSTLVNHSNYHFPVVVLNGGVAVPTALQSDGDFCSDPPNYFGPNIEFTGWATLFAHLYANVAVAMHPYHYNTDESSGQVTTTWLNYYGNTAQPGMNPPYGYSTYGHNQYGGVCSDLGNMLVTWSFWLMPFQFVFTEDNWNEGIVNPTRDYGDCNHDGVSGGNGCPGTYMVDQFNYLVNRNWTAQSPPLLIMWDTTGDFTGVPGLGIFDAQANIKYIQVFDCYKIPPIEGPNISMSSAFVYMAAGTGKPCY